jgi:hypothetical protein
MDNNNLPVTTPPGVPLLMTFKFFASPMGGMELYSEQQSVVVKNGVFNVQIGTVTLLTLPFDVPYFLEITIGIMPAETLNPRQPLASAAYALRSGCTPGDKVFCYTSAGTPGVGPCKDGLRTCNAQGTGYGPCTGEVGPNCGNVCADLATDPANCGMCGFNCMPPANATATCTSGACGAACNPGTTICGMVPPVCALLASDANNCGMCGHICGPAGACTAGACTCNGGAINCGAAGCVNPTSDVNNCGACGHVCGAGAACISGACTCPAGNVTCNGACVNPSNDVNNCGTCGHACIGGTACTSGICGACPAGNSICNGNCVNLTSNTSNCGACGNVCMAGHMCIASVCN